MSFFLGTSAFSQAWTNIPRTNIQFSQLIHHNGDNWIDVKFEYFKKGDSLIGVEKNYAKAFFDLFKSAPAAFIDIFKEAHWKTIGLNKDVHYFDSTIRKIKFKYAVIISDFKIINGHNERIWVLTNILWSGSQNSCFINVSFLKRRKNGLTNDKYLSSKYDFCEF